MNIAVYCGSVSPNMEYDSLTIELGKWIVANKYNLVYGGGNVGLMSTIADTVLDGGLEVYGVIPTFLVKEELMKDNLTHIEIVETMQERKLKMMKLSNAFIALPGGPGTLEEITEVISLKRVKEHNNPCILINYNGYYDHLKLMYKTMLNNGFIDEESYNDIHFINDISDLSNII